MKVKWLGGPKDGEIFHVDDDVERLVIALEPTDIEDYTRNLKPIKDRRLVVPIRDGHALWAEREELEPES